MNVSTCSVYGLRMSLRGSLFLSFSALSLVGAAQKHAAGTAPWLDREFRYWQGVPPMHMHEPMGEGFADVEVAGYTDEDRRMSFFRDHRYQEIIFEDRGGTTLRIWQKGYCDPLEGDTVAVLTGTWSWAHDTLHVTVERTAQYPLEDVLEHYLKRDMAKPFAMPMRPARVCNMERDRKFRFEGDRLAEAARSWD